MSDLSLAALQIAEGFVGISRKSDPAQILKFDAVFGLTGIDTSFCADGASYCIGKAFLNLRAIPYTADTIVRVLRSQLPQIAQEHLLLDPRCHIMIADAKARGTWREGLAGAKPGDLVFFCWNGTGIAQHVGFVIRVEGDTVYTLEFNTSDASQTDGGAVAHKTRSGRLVVGHISF